MTRGQTFDEMNMLAERVVEMIDASAAEFLRELDIVPKPDDSERACTDETIKRLKAYALLQHGRLLTDNATDQFTFGLRNYDKLRSLYARSSILDPLSGGLAVLMRWGVLAVDSKHLADAERCFMEITSHLAASPCTPLYSQSLRELAIIKVNKTDEFSRLGDIRQLVADADAAETVALAAWGKEIVYNGGYVQVKSKVKQLVLPFLEQHEGQPDDTLTKYSGDNFSIYAAGEELASKRKTECNHCEVTHVKLRICSRCKDAWYCSAECQKAAWKAHKHTCTPRDSKVTAPKAKISVQTLTMAPDGSSMVIPGTEVARRTALAQKMVDDMEDMTPEQRVEALTKTVATAEEHKRRIIAAGGDTEKERAEILKSEEWLFVFEKMAELLDAKYGGKKKKRKKKRKKEEDETMEEKEDNSSENENDNNNDDDDDKPAPTVPAVAVEDKEKVEKEEVVKADKVATVVEEEEEELDLD